MNPILATFTWISGSLGGPRAPFGGRCALLDKMISTLFDAIFDFPDLRKHRFPCIKLGFMLIYVDLGVIGEPRFGTLF